MPRGRPRKDTSARINRWVEQIHQAEEVLKEEQRRWLVILATYRGMHVQDGMVQQSKGIHPVNDTINWMDSIVSRMLPRYYYREPNITAVPEIDDPLATMAAKAIKDFIQKEHRFLKTGRQTRRCVLDAILFNRGWMKVGYQAFFESKDDLQKQVGASAPALPRDASTKNRKGILEMMKLKQPADIETSDMISSDSLFTRRLSAYTGSVLVDPLAPSMEEATWMAHRVAMPIEHLHGSKRYPEEFLNRIPSFLTRGEVLDHLQPRVATLPTNLRRFFTSLREPSQDEDKSWVIFYEIWDKLTGKLYVVHKQVTERFGREQGWPHDLVGFPFISLQFGEDPVSFYGQPLAEKWLPMVQDLNEYREIRRERVRKAIRKYLIDEGAIHDDTLDELESNEDSSIVKLRSTSMNDVRKAVSRLDPAGSVTPELATSEQIARQDLSGISGVSEQRRGVSSRYQTATEASIIEAAAADLEGDRIQTVSEFQTDIASGLFTLARQYVSAERILLTTGLDGEALYSVGAFLRRTHFDISVRVGSSRFLSEDQRLQNLERFLMMTLQTGMGDYVRIQRDIADLLDVPTDYVIDPNDPANEERLAKLAVVRQLMGIRLNAIGGDQNGFGNIAPGGAAGGRETAAQNTADVGTLAAGAVTPEVPSG